MTKCVIRQAPETEKIVEFWLEEGGAGIVKVCCTGGWNVVAFKPTDEGIRLYRYKSLGNHDVCTVEDNKIAMTKE